MARLNQPSDTSLASSLQAGDLKSLEFIIDRYQEPLLRYVSYLGASEEVADIVQLTFIKVYQNINSYDVKRKFSTWIYRIAHNTAVSALRSKHFTWSWDEYLDNFVKVDPVDDIDKKSIVKQIRGCLKNLPLRYRSPLALHYLEDKSYTEIMDILRLPMGTVSARINRAKKIMRSLCQKI
jgi:RNA polymerase sigma-70 factor (ECF subfamily)